MSVPRTIKDFGPEAHSQIEQAVQMAVSTVFADSPVPWQTGEVAIASPPTITQLPAQATPHGVYIRIDSDVLLNSANSPTGGLLVYEGDLVRFPSIRNLDQVYVLPVKNNPATLRWATL